MEDLIQKYLESKKNSWSHTTMLSEGYRLRKVSSFISGNPEVLWQHIQYMAPYSRATTWTRVTAFYSFTHPKETNPYEQFRQENQNYFKNVYQTKKVEISYDDCLKKIGEIKCAKSRALATAIIKSGVRFCESQQPYGRGFILGKGGKVRPDFRPALLHSDESLYGPADGQGASQGQLSYVSFYRALRAVGLRPHSLRKLAASKASRNGAKAEDLCEIFGWSSIETAIRYLQPESTEQLKKFLE